jgi:hypothetical protein
MDDHDADHEPSTVAPQPQDEGRDEGADDDAPDDDAPDDDAGPDPEAHQQRGLKKSDLLIALAVILVVVVGGLAVSVLTDEDEGGGGQEEQEGRPTDDFNRPHSPDTVGVAGNGDAWDAVSGVWGIDAAQVYLAVPQLDGSPNFLLLDMGSPNGEISAVFARTRLGSGLVFRYASPEDYYVLLPAGGFGTWIVQHLVNGEATLNESVGLAPSDDGTTVTLGLDGDQATVQIADEEPATVQLDDDGGDATRVGFTVQGFRAEEARWDDFYGIPS